MTVVLEKPSREPIHIPVLRREVVEAFDFNRPVVVVDGTLGLGGHAEALLESYPQMSVIGVEWDTIAIDVARRRLALYGSRFQAIEGSYAELVSLLKDMGSPQVDGLLLDLGVSSLHLDDAARGFSFTKKGPLDMRMSQRLPETAWSLLQRLDVTELTSLFRELGEEPRAALVARKLKEALVQGELNNDSWLVAQSIRALLPSGRGKIDPATRCFQALRMAVNHELDNVKAVLGSLRALLNPKGRAVILAFHSLEDRLVKQAFQMAAKGCVCPPQIPQCICGQKPWARLPQRKAIQASDEEISTNSRARSARLRVLEKL